MTALPSDVHLEWRVRAPDWAEAESAALRPAAPLPHPERSRSATTAPMPAKPAVLAHHRDRAQRRLRENVRQAALHGADRAHLARIVQQAVTGDLTLTEANERVLAIRSRLGQRRAA